MVFQVDREFESSFDNVLETVQMFDSADERNWQILNLSMTESVGSIVILLLESMQENSMSLGLLELLLTICQTVSAYQPDLSEEDAAEEVNVIENLQIGVKAKWARVYGLLSQSMFDNCVKYLMTILVDQDYRKLNEQEVAY